MDVRAEHQLLFPLLPVVRLHPDIGSHGFRSCRGSCFAGKEIILSVNFIEAAYRQVALLQLKLLLTSDDSRLAFCRLQRIRERSAVP